MIVETFSGIAAKINHDHESRLWCGCRIRAGHWWVAWAAAHTLGVETPALRWIDPPEGPAIALLDQTRLPAAEAIVTCGDVPALVDAIRRLVVRGAPMLGVAGAFGVALAAYRGDDVAAAAAEIEQARPTAVNLGWGVRRAHHSCRSSPSLPRATSPFPLVRWYF